MSTVTLSTERAAWLRGILAERGIMQRHIVNATGIDQGTVSKFINANGGTSEANVLLIEDYLELPGALTAPEPAPAPAPEEPQDTDPVEVPAPDPATLRERFLGTAEPATTHDPDVALTEAEAAQVAVLVAVEDAGGTPIPDDLPAVDAIADRISMQDGVDLTQLREGLAAFHDDEQPKAAREHVALDESAHRPTLDESEELFRVAEVVEAVAQGVDELVAEMKDERDAEPRFTIAQVFNARDVVAETALNACRGVPVEAQHYAIAEALLGLGYINVPKTLEEADS